MNKRTYVADNDEKPVDTRSPARIAFDTAHGAIIGMISSAAAGHPTNTETARIRLDKTIEAYGSLTQQEKIGLYPQISSLLESAAQHNIKPSTKPRVAAPAVQARTNEFN